MEKNKGRLALSLVVCLIGLVPLVIVSRIVKGMDNDLLIALLETIARAGAAFAIIFYVKKAYKIKIGIKKDALLKGVFWHGLTAMIFCAAMLVFNYEAPERSVLGALPILLYYALVNFCIGMFEEALCRGLLFNSFKAFFGDNKKGVYLSSFLSAFLFGALHLGNLNGNNTLATLTQVIYATFFGIFFAAIYYRTGNLLACMIIHGAVDYVDIFWHCFKKDRMAAKLAEQATDSSIGESIVALAVTSVFLISALLQLRKVFKVRGAAPGETRVLQEA